jgi:hypothetical protein
MTIQAYGHTAHYSDTETVDMLVTKDLLVRGGIPVRTIPESTIRYFLRAGYSPQRIAIEVWHVCPACSTVVTQES